MRQTWRNGVRHHESGDDDHGQYFSRALDHQAAIVIAESRPFCGRPAV
jgi:hypothetical protein